MKPDYSELENTIGIQFQSHDLLTTAFIHKSFINENRDYPLTHNERLEFLGDAVLELAATKHLFITYPNQDEGQMTSFRSSLVKGNHLAEVARELNIGKYLLLSKGEERSGGREKSIILANCMESLIGCIYLDRGYEEVEKFIKRFIITKLDQIIQKGLHIDAKSKFQELAQEKESFTPYYELISESGPDHDKEFVMGAYINGLLIAEGKGSSKQKAENEAAINALMAKGW